MAAPKHRPQPRSQRAPVGEVGRTWVPDCGKWGHPTRAEARQAAKKMRKRGNQVHAYHCDRCGWFHTGHLPRAVRGGEVTRDEWYDGQAAAAEWRARRTGTEG